MTRLESEKVFVEKSSEEIYSFLSDFNNFGKLMPPQVTGWSSTAEECSFTIQGMATLGMKYSAKTPFSHITIIPSGKVPFDFKLYCDIEQAGSGSEVRLAMDASLNPFLKMMAEKPLTNFLNLLANKLKEL
jgi:carbon monoxide dehydrogenase subunit G